MWEIYLGIGLLFKFVREKMNEFMVKINEKNVKKSLVKEMIIL